MKYRWIADICEGIFVKVVPSLDQRETLPLNTNLQPLEIDRCMKL